LWPTFAQPLAVAPAVAKAASPLVMQPSTAGEPGGEIRGMSFSDLIFIYNKGAFLNNKEKKKEKKQNLNPKP
jgi:hypothetical protein